MNESAKDDEIVPMLRACIRDLAALSALPSLWVGREPPQVVHSLLDILSAALRLDLAYARIEDPRGGETVEAARVNGAGKELARARVRELGELLTPSSAPRRRPRS
ncbi:MAG: hypothetical protein KIS78_22460 [Labilithrix sp.]|nr:hypothetical protein [Labilithrix sp.]